MLDCLDGAVHLAQAPRPGLPPALVRVLVHLTPPLGLGLQGLVIVHHTDQAQPAVLLKELVEWRCPFPAVLFTRSSKAVDAVFVVAAQPLHLRPHLTQFLAQPLNFCYGALVVLW